MRRLSRLAVFLMLAALALTLASMLSISRLPDALQYVVPAPVEPKQGAQDGQDGDDGADERQAASSQLLLSMMRARESMEEMPDSIASWTLDGYRPEVAVRDARDQTQTAELHALGEGHDSLYPATASQGRLLYPEELRYGDRVALLSEQLCVKLLRASDPIGKKITIDGVEYTVVGTLRRNRQLGDAGEYQVYVPLRAIAKDVKTELSLLTLSALPQAGSGAAQAFGKAAAAWMPGGSLHQLEREKIAQMLMPRWLLSALGLCALVMGFAAWGRRAVRYASGIRERLRQEYLKRMLPGIAGRALVMLVLLAGLGCCCALLMRFAARPILLYPEWVPEVPVEWDYIAGTFWTLQMKAAARAQYLSAEVARLRFFGGLAALGSVLGLLAAVAQGWKMRKG